MLACVSYKCWYRIRYPYTCILLLIIFDHHRPTSSHHETLWDAIGRYQTEYNNIMQQYNATTESVNETCQEIRSDQGSGGDSLTKPEQNQNKKGKDAIYVFPPPPQMYL